MNAARISKHRSDRPSSISRPPSGPLLCAALTHHLGLRRFAGPFSDPGPRGTFDFKWYPGERVRIALLVEEGDRQNQHEYAKVLLEECIRRWLHREGVRVNLTVEVVPDLVEPNGSQVDYDVLARCPRKDTVLQGGFVELAARTQLGSYSRREDFGTATLFIPLEGPDSSSWSPKDPLVFTDPAVLEDMVGAMHEMGHVLGLPHAHQSPRLALDKSWQPATSHAYATFFDQFGVGTVPVDQITSFIEGDLKSTLLGRLEHGHWWPFAENEFVDSIMTYRKLDDCLFVPAERACFGPLLASGKVANPADRDELLHWTVPTEADFRLIVEMYGRR